MKDIAIVTFTRIQPDKSEQELRLVLHRDEPMVLEERIKDRLGEPVWVPVREREHTLMMRAVARALMKSHPADRIDVGVFS